MDEVYGDDQTSDNGASNPDEVSTGAGEAAKPTPLDTPDNRKLVTRILNRIRLDKLHFKKAYERMDRSMFMALHGRDKDWPENHYKANITGQHIKTKTAALYAKNPKVVAQRKESLDFLVWDETVESLQQAWQILQQFQAVQQATMAAQSGVFAPAQQMGHNGGPPMEQAPATPPVVPPEVQQAGAVIQDFQQGMARRLMLKKFGRTLELVFANAMRQQTPLDFKPGMKRVVRRALTTAVGYVELGFQETFGIPSAITEQLADARERIAHLEDLAQRSADDELEECKGEIAELQAMVAAMEAQPQQILRRGLTFDFLQSTHVIPDRISTSLVGFTGSRHLTLRYLQPKTTIEETYKVGLGTRYTPYTPDGKRTDGTRGVDMGDDSTEGVFGAKGDENDLVCLYKHYDKMSGLVYHVIDGHPNFIKAPAAPDVTVPRFWPVYALTFNDVESEKELFPKSDAELVADQQNELNRSRQGKREHRNAARPRWAYANGMLDEEEDIPRLKNAQPFDAIGLNGLGPEQKVSDVLQPIQTAGVDPNLYDTGEILQDATMTVGAQAAQLGGLSKSTATGVAVADDSQNTVDGSSIDDLDAFVTAIARDGGIILMQKLQKVDVTKIAGNGAVWVEDLQMDLEDIYSEVYLQVEAGSTGKPNQAADIRNFKDIGPLLLQMPSISPEWLAKEALRRLDDRMDLTDAIISGIPAIVAQNRNAQPGQGDPTKDPNQQGPQGGDKTKTPSAPAGTSAPIGNNHSPAV